MRNKDTRYQVLIIAIEGEMCESCSLLTSVGERVGAVGLCVGEHVGPLFCGGLIAGFFQPSLSHPFPGLQFPWSHLSPLEDFPDLFPPTDPQPSLSQPFLSQPPTHCSALLPRSLHPLSPPFPHFSLLVGFPVGFLEMHRVVGFGVWFDGTLVGFGVVGIGFLRMREFPRCIELKIGVGNDKGRLQCMTLHTHSSRFWGSCRIRGSCRFWSWR